MMIYPTNPTPDDRLNSILDKISTIGLSKLDDKEKQFLKSYSSGKEAEINNQLLQEESEKTFLSDDGNFMFRLDNIDIIDNDVYYINGVLFVPDIKVNKRTIKGELKGSIIIFSGGRIAIDFTDGQRDVFDFVGGMEYELDCFMDEIAIKIKPN